MSEKDFLDCLVENLIELMRDNQMSQRELAELSGLSEGTISRYLSKKSMPTLKAAVNMSIALCCELTELVYFDDYIE